jgi:hypothetical protein
MTPPTGRWRRGARMFLNGDEISTADATASGSSTTRSCSVQRRTTRMLVHAAQPLLRRGVGARASTAEPEREAGAFAAGARDEIAVKCRSVTVLRRRRD